MTHLENSKEEWSWLLEKVGLSDAMEIAEKYRFRRSDETLAESQSVLFKDVSIKAVQSVYRRYYTDFVSFGYSPQFVSSFISHLNKYSKVVYFALQCVQQHL